MPKANTTAKSNSLKNRAELQQKQAEAFMKAQKLKHMMKKPKPRVQG